MAVHNYVKWTYVNQAPDFKKKKFFICIKLSLVCTRLYHLPFRFEPREVQKFNYKRLKEMSALYFKIFLNL